VSPFRLARGHGDAGLELASILWRHRELTWAMARRELSDRYAGQAFGVAWAIWHPVFMIGLYVFIFAVVFKQKVGGSREMPLDYIAYLLSGMVAWMSIQESMLKSCTAITSNSSLVKQVVFPLEILPVKGVLVSFVPQFVSLAMLVVYVLVTHGSLHATYALLPVLIFLQGMLMVGLAYILSAIGVYFRDAKDVVQLFATAGAYLVPVFYLPNWVPDLFKPVLYINPFSYVIWCYQDALYFGRFEHPWAWVVTTIFSVTTFVIGYRVFRKLKPALGNVI
jgi:lipopolysaccharide transport system permease protein